MGTLQVLPCCKEPRADAQAVGCHAHPSYVNASGNRDTPCLLTGNVPSSPRSTGCKDSSCHKRMVLQHDFYSGAAANGNRLLTHRSSMCIFSQLCAWNVTQHTWSWLLWWEQVSLGNWQGCNLPVSDCWIITCPPAHHSNDTQLANQFQHIPKRICQMWMLLEPCTYRSPWCNPLPASPGVKASCKRRNQRREATRTG